MSGQQNSVYLHYDTARDLVCYRTSGPRTIGQAKESLAELARLVKTTNASRVLINVSDIVPDYNYDVIAPYIKQYGRKLSGRVVAIVDSDSLTEIGTAVKALSDLAWNDVGFFHTTQEAELWLEASDINKRS